MKHNRFRKHAGVVASALTAALLMSCGGNTFLPSEDKRIPSPTETVPLKYPELTPEVYTTIYYGVFADIPITQQRLDRVEAFSKLGFSEAINPDGQIDTSKFYAEGKITYYGFRDNQQVANPRTVYIDIETSDPNKKLPVTIQVTPQKGINFKDGGLLFYLGDVSLGSYYEEWDKEQPNQYNIEFFGDSYTISGNNVLPGRVDQVNFARACSEDNLMVFREMKDEHGNRTGVKIPLRPDEVVYLSEQLDIVRASVDFFTLGVEDSIFEQFSNELQQ